MPHGSQADDPGRLPDLSVVRHAVEQHHRQQRGLWHWLRGRIGHRGAFLLFLALLDTGLGYTLVSAESDRIANVAGNTFARLLSYNTVLPLDAWGGLWLATALLCFTGAFARHDRLAYAAASFMKTAWAALYLDLTLFHHYTKGWIAFLFWLAFAATVLIISSWPEGGKSACGAGRNADDGGPGGK